MRRMRDLGRTPRTLNMYSYFIEKYKLENLAKKSAQEINTTIANLPATRSDKHFIVAILRKFHKFSGLDEKKIDGVIFISKEREIFYTKSRIIDVINLSPEPFKSYYLLLWSTGCRRLLGLHIHPKLLDFDTGRIQIPEDLPGNKSKKKFTIFIDMFLVSGITKLMQTYRVRRSSPIFLTCFKKFLKEENEDKIPQLITNKTIQFARRAGIINFKQFTPNAIRHSHATYYLDSGGSLEGLSYGLGHSNTMMTERYAHQREKRLKRELNKIKFN